MNRSGFLSIYLYIQVFRVIQEYIILLIEYNYK